MNVYKLIRPLLWRTDAEKAHDFVLNGLGRLSRSQLALNMLRRTYGQSSTALRVDAFGLTFPNCVGLAAGLDKNAVGLPALAALGFGFLEVGTVTPRSQAGNPKPRLWRLAQHQALINRLGFNNAGADVIGANLAKDAPCLHVPLGINIGKNAVTPLENALDDYVACWRKLHHFADYVVVNVSSPNTAGLRSLQQTDTLTKLLSSLKNEMERTATSGRSCPLLVKIAPDVNSTQLDGIVDACLQTDVSGIVATNTTIRRNGVSGPMAEESGGLSGRPLRDLSNQVVAALYRRVGHRLAIIGVGGIMDEHDAYAKIKAGATLLQVLTGFVYAGPDFPARLITGLQRLLQEDGLNHIRDAVGADAHRYDELPAT